MKELKKANYQFNYEFIDQKDRNKVENMLYQQLKNIDTEYGDNLGQSLAEILGNKG